jgi:hypothetical protein
MKSPFRRLCSVTALMAVLGLGPLAAPGLAQKDGEGKSEGNKPEQVKFDTADGVKIRGSFYASARKNAPVVMILHALEEKSTQKAYTELAETLQKKDLNVLTFDFRGHGNSKEVEPAEFWTRNRSYVKGGPGKTEIEIKDIAKQSYPVLVNDIAAAKAFLDRRNDQGGCNSSNLILVGAGTGATLGAIWLNSEFYRYKGVPNPVGVVTKLESRPEGLNTVCAVWLSISPDLGGRPIKLTSLLDMAANKRAVPMVFMYNDSDTKTKDQAKAINKKIGTWVSDKSKAGAGMVRKDADKYPFTDAVAISKAGKLNGSGLLQNSLGTQGSIAKYISDVVEAKGNEYVEHDFRKTVFFWLNPANPNPNFRASWIPAKPPNGMTMLWDTYERFVPR